MDREITLRDYGRVVWSGRWLILATTVAAAVVGLLLTFVTSTIYTAEAELFVGQATTASGTPVSTPATNPATAPTVLTGDNIVTQVAKQIGVSPKRVRNGVTVTAPRAPGGAVGNLPTVVTIRFKDESRSVARDGANAYAQAVLTQARAGFSETYRSYQLAVTTGQTQVTTLQGQIEAYRRQLATAPAGDRLTLQTLLASTGQQLQVATTDLSNQRQLLNAQRNFQPTIISLATSPSSSGSVGNRTRSVLLAAVIGLIIGVIVTFVWRGSPAGRAGRE